MAFINSSRVTQYEYLGSFAALSVGTLLTSPLASFVNEYADLEHRIEQYLDVIVLARKVLPHHSHFRSI